MRETSARYCVSGCFYGNFRSRAEEKVPKHIFVFIQCRSEWKYGHHEKRTGLLLNEDGGR